MKDPLTKTQEIPFQSRSDEENALNLMPPNYQLLDRSDDEDKKECRICLEDDNEDDMIAPCQCKGGSKWVHRECLDLWRINEKDRAFSKCTECLFQYHMQPVRQQEDTSANNWRRAKFTMLVSRDFCFFTLLLQLAIGLLGSLVWLCDQDKAIPLFICGGCDGRHALGVYYLCGFLLVLVSLGCYGSVILCSNKCSVSDSIPSFDQEETPTYHRSEVYRSRRQRHGRYRRHAVYDPFFPYYMPIYVGDNNGTCCCCNTHSSSNSSGGCDCCPHHFGGTSGGGGGGGNSNGNAHILLVFLLVVAIIMAAIGFVVGVIIAVVGFQRIVRRHVFLLHRRQLVEEFEVLDLSGYDLDKTFEGDETVDVGVHPAPSAPQLREDDESYLKLLGLMDA